MGKIIKRTYDNRGKPICPVCKRKNVMSFPLEVAGYYICTDCFRLCFLQALAKRSVNPVWKSLLVEVRDSLGTTWLKS